MAYSVNKYHVFTAAGLSAEDTNEQAYTKIAAWLNGILSDFGTAEVFDTPALKRAVKFMFKDVRAGICFGQVCSSGDSNAVSVINSKGSDTLNIHLISQSYGSITNTETLYLFTAISDYGAFIVLESTQPTVGFRHAAAYCLKCKDSNDGAKSCCFGFNGTGGSSSASNDVYFAQVGGEGLYRVASESMSTNLQKNLAAGNKTMLTKFYVPYTDCVPEGGYLVGGNIPNAQTVFEINGGKYVIGYNYDNRFVVALKLE